MAVQRKNLEVDRIYKDRSNGLYAYTPDGVGCIWFDTLAEAREETGIELPVIVVSEIEDF